LESLQHSDMVKAGMASGPFKASEPLPLDDEQALHLWANLGAELRWPDIAYELDLAGVQDVELMLDRLRTIRSTVSDFRSRAHG